MKNTAQTTTTVPSTKKTYQQRAITTPFNTGLVGHNSRVLASSIYFVNFTILYLDCSLQTVAPRTNNMNANMNNVDMNVDRKWKITIQTAVLIKRMSILLDFSINLTLLICMIVTS